MVLYSNLDLFNGRTPRITHVNYNIINSITHNYNYRLEYYYKLLAQEEGLRNILKSAPLCNKYRNILVDVKTEVIKKGDIPCGKKGWHLDGKKSRNTNTKRQSLYHILVIGGCSTEFLADPLLSKNYGIINQNVFAKYNLDNNSNLSVYTLPLNCWNTYTEDDWHRGAVAQEDTTRTFIRIVESNYIKPQGKKWKNLLMDT